MRSLQTALVSLTHQMQRRRAYRTDAERAIRLWHLAEDKRKARAADYTDVVACLRWHQRRARQTREVAYR